MSTYNVKDNNKVVSNTLNQRDEYPDLLEIVKDRFNSKVNDGTKLFIVNVEDLYEIYLESIPAEIRNTYVCNACRHFVNRYGGLVTINDKGEMESVLWNENEVPALFAKAVKALKRKVLTSNVSGVFVSEFKNLGQAVTGEWTHFAVSLPTGLIHRSRTKTSEQVQAEKLEEYRMLSRALRTYSLDVTNTALSLIQTDFLYRSDAVLGVAEWFKSVHEKCKAAKNKENVVWSAVAAAPSGFCHIKSSMIGTLLEDIASGLPFESVGNRFAEKMKNHMRSQAAPGQGNIDRAEVLVSQLGIANSLRRRYAKFEEIPKFVWKNKQSEKSVAKANSGVFGHIAPKQKISQPTDYALPSTLMTWDKFQRTVLPTAESIELMVDNPNRFMALVTAADETSENILQWNNPFSWYYHAGIDGEIKRRVENAGGQYENNEIRCSLIWEGYTDLDLHCITPNGEHIYFQNSRDTSRGWLDIDMNGGNHRDSSPVENIRWSNNAPTGRYRFYIHNFSQRDIGKNVFKVELEINGQVYTYSGIAERTSDFKEVVFDFDYVRGQEPKFHTSLHSSESLWSVPLNSFVKVSGITNSPNLWDEKPVSKSGTHVFFLLEDCKDLSEGKGRGFFNETLKSELREIRKTLEAYTANTPIEDADKASACGVGYSKENMWNATLKVTANNSSRLIKIDRWD